MPIKCALAEGNRGIPVSLHNQPQQPSYQPVIAADMGRAGWPALVQIKNVPVGFYCSRNVRVVFLSFHVGDSASVSPVEFSKRPMSAVGNYPFHTPHDGRAPGGKLWAYPVILIVLGRGNFTVNTESGYGFQGTDLNQKEREYGAYPKLSSGESEVSLDAGVDLAQAVV